MASRATTPISKNFKVQTCIRAVLWLGCTPSNYIFLKSGRQGKFIPIVLGCPWGGLGGTPPPRGQKHRPERVPSLDPISPISEDASSVCIPYLHAQFWRHAMASLGVASRVTTPILKNFKVQTCIRAVLWLGRTPSNYIFLKSGRQGKFIPIVFGCPWGGLGAVSYTHLTLPTNREV